MGGSLSHLRVLDLSRVLAGPWATQFLADLGAQVLKVERPGQGDDTRGWGPPFLRDEAGQPTDQSAYFLSANRGKQSLCIDFTQERGRDLLHRLVAQCDIVVENFKVGGLAKYGLDYETLRAIKPDLIYCSITGFGQTGPYAHRAGYDFLVQGMGGLMSLTGTPDGEPMKVGVALTDIFTGMYAAAAITAALVHRDRTGQGQVIDLALLDVQAAVLANQAANYLIGGIVPGRLGNAHPNIVPYQAFAAADGHLILAIGNDAQFARFCEVAGHPEWSTDPRFVTNADRVGHRGELVALLQQVLATRPKQTWIDQLEAVLVPCGPINAMDEVFANPQIRHRDMVVQVEHPLAGSVPLVANPVKMSETPPAYDRAPPVLGADTRTILAELLGVDEAEFQSLADARIVSD